MPTVFFLLGLLGIPLELTALWLALSRRGPKPLPLSRLALCIGIGAAIALASWVVPTAFGYPATGARGEGRLVGIPFVIAFFDAEGEDFTGSLTPVFAAANALFWLLLPLGLLTAYRLLRPTPIPNDPGAVNGPQ